MMTNPFAYYDDEPLPVNFRPLAASSDGEEESDMEPRGPLELKGHFITAFMPAVRTYQINVVRETFECRLPNGEYLQLSREEAREQVSVHGNEIDIVPPGSRSYCFRCSQRGNDLSLARLKVWLQPPQTDPEKAYHAVAEQLKKHILGSSLTWLCTFFLAWLIFMVYLDYPYWKFDRPGVLLHAALLNFGVCLLRFVCAVLFSVFLAFRLFGQVNIPLLRISVILSLIFPFYCLIIVFARHLQIQNFPINSPFLEIWFPINFSLIIFMQYNRYHRSNKQLQRENGLI